MLKNSVLQIMLLGALLSPMAQADPGCPSECGGQVHTVDAPQIWFGEPLSDNANDPPRYRDGYAQDAQGAPTVKISARWRVWAVDREEPKPTVAQIEQSVKDWLKDKAVAALQKVAENVPLASVVKNADKVADAMASGDFRRGIWVTYVLQAADGSILDKKVEKLSGDDELPWQIKGGDASGQQKVLGKHVNAMNRPAETAKR